MAVEVRWAELERYWEECEWDQEFFWEFRIEGDRQAAWLPLNEVIRDVCDLFEQTEGPSSGALEDTFDGFCSYFSPDGEADEIEAFFREVGRRAEARGLSGVIMPWRGDPWPEWAEEWHAPLVLTAVAGLPPLPERRPIERFVAGSRSLPTETGELLIDTVLPWVDQAAGTPLLSRGMSTVVVPDGSDLAAEIRSSISRATVRVIKVTEQEPGWCSAILDAPATLQHSRPGAAPGVDDLHRLVEMLRALGPHADLAAVGLGIADSLGWEALFPNVRDDDQLTRVARWGSRAHLWSQQVLDAYVAQVLTSRHLDGIGGLSADWSVEELGNDRFLVVHREPERWLPQPEPTVVAAARAEFAPIILQGIPQ